MQIDDTRTEPLLAIPGIAELWPILAVVFLLFGARKLPELARAMGSSVTQFKKGLDSKEEEAAKQVEGAPGSDGDTKS
ncbi:twin-arginine translocase TatA/TatE family subunit [bacterium]|nr:twin-arginine translocase TatA/TatE family subunit [bacterium]